MRKKGLDTPPPADELLQRYTLRHRQARQNAASFDKAVSTPASSRACLNVIAINGL